MPRQCYVCRKTDVHKDLLLHRFPANPEQKNIWFAALAIDPNTVTTKRPLVCSTHFDNTDYYYKRDGKKYLNTNAVPKLVEYSTLSRSPSLQSVEILDGKSDTFNEIESRCSSTTWTAPFNSPRPSISDMPDEYNNCPQDGQLILRDASNGLKIEIGASSLDSDFQQFHSESSIMGLSPTSDCSSTALTAPWDSPTNVPSGDDHHYKRSSSSTLSALSNSPKQSHNGSDFDSDFTNFNYMIKQEEIIIKIENEPESVVQPQERDQGEESSNCKIADLSNQQYSLNQGTEQPSTNKITDVPDITKIKWSNFLLDRSSLICNNSEPGSRITGSNHEVKDAPHNLLQLPIATIDDARASNLSLSLTIRKISLNPNRYLGLSNSSLKIINSLELKSKLDVVSTYLTLMKIRTGRTFGELADDFALTRPRCALHVFKNAVAVLAPILEKSIVWQEKNQRLRSRFKVNIKAVGSILNLWNVKFKTTKRKLKYLISFSPDGKVNFLSKGFTEATPLYELVRNCGYLDLLKSDDVIMLGRGLESVKQLILTTGCILVPYPTVEFANFIPHADQVLRRLRLFRFLSPAFPKHSLFAPLMDNIMCIACGLISTGETKT